MQVQQPAEVIERPRRKNVISGYLRGDQVGEFAAAFLKTAVAAWLRLLRRGFSLLATRLKPVSRWVKTGVQNSMKEASRRLKLWRVQMIGAIEKGVEAARLSSPPPGTYEGVDLRVLPKYICFKAALLREKLILQYAVLVLTVILGGHFIFTRFEIASLYTKLREKEYILAPGVQDFIPAAPQKVPERHVLAAVMDYLSQFGSINPVNIDDQYQRLSDAMTNELKVQFLAEASKWKAKVKSDNLSEIMTVLDKTVESDEKGNYRCTANVRTDSFVNNEHIGYRDEVVEMSMKLVPPEDGKRWYLQVSALTRTSKNAFTVKDSLFRSPQHE